MQITGSLEELGFMEDRGRGRELVSEPVGELVCIRVEFQGEFVVPRGLARGNKQ